MESWTSHSSPEVSTELLISRTEFSTTAVTEWGDSSTVANITDAYQGSAKEQGPGTEARTVRDLTAAELTEKDITDIDITESVPQTDSTYISTTISRVGERTLLSVMSNSTTPYTEESSSSEADALTNTSEMRSTGVTQAGDHTNDAFSTEADNTRATSENQLSSNSTQESEPEVPHASWGTHSQTRQPNATELGFEVTSNSGHNSTLPITVVNSDSETDTAVDSSTSGTSYTGNSASAPSVTPFMSPEDSRTNVSLQDSEAVTTETPTGPMNTVGGEMPDGPPTHMDETTILGLTTAPPSLTTVDDSFSKFLSGQQPFNPQTHHLPEATEVLTTTAEPVTQRPQHTEEDTHMASTASSTVASTVVTTMLPSTSTSTSAPFTTHQPIPSTTAKMQTPFVAVSTMETTQMLTTPTTEQQTSTVKTSTPPQSSSSSQPADISTDVSTLHLETSTATPGNTTAYGRHTTASYSKSGPTRSTAVMTTGKHTDSSTQMEATTTQIPVKFTPTPGVFSASPTRLLFYHILYHFFSYFVQLHYKLKV